ncbi:MAG TPA: DUF4129 domain-containing protein [Pseudonocardiaceae bacterium]|nr:DUF4129 domain-containing protein [Pseudonocardiaceae bacterium]
MPSPTRARLLPLLLSLAALLLLTVLVARGGSAVPQGTGFLTAPTSNPPLHLHVNPLQGRNLGKLNPVVGITLSSEIALALVVALFGLAMAMLMLTSIRVRRRRRFDEPAVDGDDGLLVPGGDLAMLLQGTRSALAWLRQRAGGPPGDAVQQAWLALEEAAAESGTARLPQQTSTEFTAAVLAAHRVDPDALATLRGLYQRARFGEPDSVTEADAELAIAALDTIAETLAARRREAAT